MKMKPAQSEMLQKMHTQYMHTCSYRGSLFKTFMVNELVERLELDLALVEKSIRQTMPVTIMKI